MKALIKTFIINLVLTASLLASGDVCIVDLRFTSLDVPKFNHLVTCAEEDTLSFQINASDNASLTGLVLNVDLPADMEFTGYLAILPSGPAFPSPASQPGSPVVSLPSIAAGDSLIVMMSLKAGCEVKELWENREPIDISYNLSYNGGSYSYTPLLEYNTSIYIPVLNILDISPYYPIVNTGESYTRDVRISQDGLKAYLNDFVYMDQHNGGVVVEQLEIFNADLSLGVNLPFSEENTTISASIDQSVLESIGMPGNFDETAELVIRETVRAVSCESVSTLSEFMVAWGCDGALCDTTSRINGYNVPQSFPNLEVELIDASEITFCSDIYKEFLISNNAVELFPASSFASDIKMILEPSCDLSEFNQEFQLNDIYINGTSVPFSTDIDNNQIAVEVNNLEDIDQDGEFDDVASLTSFSFRIEYSMNCQNMGCDAEASCLEGFKINLDYNDQCSNPRPQKKFTFPGSFNVASSTFTIDSEPVIETVNTNIPITLCYSFDGNMPVCDDGSLDLMIQGDKGYIIPQSAIIDEDNSSFSGTLSTGVNANEYIISGATMTPADTEICWTIFSSYDEPCGIVDSEALNFEINFNCPCAGCEIKRGCQSYVYSINHPCDPGFCSEIETTSLQMERATFGWTDGTLTTLVDVSTPDILLDRAYACDQVAIQATGIINHPNPSTLDEIKSKLFVYHSFSDENSFLFSDALIQINGIDVACTLTPVFIEFDGSSSSFEIDLTDCLLNNSTITLSTGDIIDLTLNARVLQQDESKGNFYLTQVKSTFETTINNNVTACNYKLTDFYVMTPDIVPAAQPSIEEGCEGNIIITGSLFIQSGTGDDFPNEFRPWFGDVSATLFDLPEGLMVIEELSEVIIYGDNEISMQANIIVSEDGQMIEFLSASNVWPIIDKTTSGITMEFKLHMIPTCNLPPNENFTFEYNLTENYYATAFGSSCAQEVSESIDVPLNYTPPVFGINLLSPIVEAENEIAIFDFQVCNISNANAVHNWMSFESELGDFNFLEISDISDENNIIQMPTNNYGAGENIYVEFDGFTASECRTIRLTSSYSTCHPSDYDVLFGWNCVDNFINPELGYASGGNCTESVSVGAQSIVPFDGKMQANLLEFGSPIELCEDSFFEIEFKNVEKATVYDIEFHIIMPLEGSQIVPSSLQFAYPISSPYVSISVDPTPISTSPLGIRYRVNINDVSPILSQNGLPGVPTQNDIENRFRVKFDIDTNCDIVSGETFRFETWGYKPCGEQTKGALQGAQIFIDDAAPPYLTTFELSSGEIFPCETVQTDLTVRVTNNGPATMGDNDFLQLVMPAGIHYVENSTQFIVPNSWNPGNPTIDYILGLEQLTWPTPSGIGINDIIEFNFQIEGEESITCFTESFTIETYTYDVAQCSTSGDICAFAVNTGEAFLELEVQKPDIQFTNNTEVFGSCSQTGEIINATIEIINIGEPVPSSTTTYFSFYNDINLNEIVDENDLLLGTIPYTNEIPTNEIITINHSLQVDGGSACPLLITVDDESNCICTQPTISFAGYDYYNAGDDQFICSNEIEVQLGCDPIPGYTYQWTSVQDPTLLFLSCSTCANPVVTIPNNSPNPITITYQLSTKRGYSVTACTTIDAVTLTVIPTEFGSEEIVLCESESVQFNGPANGTNYIWSPINGFGNQTIYNPMVTPPVGTTIYTLQYESNDGCLGTWETTTVVEENPIPEISIAGEVSFCEGEQGISLDAGAGYSSYMWQQTGSDDILSVDQIFMPTETGSYYVSVISNSNNQCPSNASDPITVEVNGYNTPTIQPVGPLNICPGESVELFVLGDYPEVNWYLASDPPPLGAIIHSGPIYVASEAGNYIVEALDANQCVGISAADSVSVYPQQTIVISADGTNHNNLNICEDDFSTLTAFPADFEGYIWSLNGGIIATGVNTLDVYQAGTYIVEANDPNACNVVSEPIFIEYTENPNPGISVIGETTFCENGQVTLMVTEEHETYQWYKDDNIIINATNQSIVVTQSGQYYSVVTDNECEGQTSSINVNVIPDPVVNIFSSNNIDLCYGEEVSISTSVGFSSYQWYNAGLPLFQETGTILTVSEPGQYYVEGTSSFGCSAFSEIVEVQYLPIPEPQVLADMICENGDNLIVASTGFITYQWIYNGDLQEDQDNDEFFNAPGAGTVQVSVTDQFGCTGLSDIANIEVHLPMQVNAFADDTEICENTGTTLYANSSAVTYEWSPSQGLSCTDCIQPFANPSENTTYTVTVTDINGCSYTDEILIEVISNPDVQLIGSSHWCPEEIEAIVASPGFVSYDFYLNGIDHVQTGPINSFIPAETGTYNVISTTSEGCKKHSNTIIIQIFDVYDVELFPFTFENGNTNNTDELDPIFAGNYNFCDGGDVVIQASFGFLVYDWYLNNVLVQSGSSEFIVTESGEYQVIATDVNGCVSESETITINVLANPLPQVIEIAPTSFCVGESSTLAVAGTYEIIIWKKDGIAIENANLNYLEVTEPGFYNVYVNNLDGCEGESLPVLVEVYDVPDFTFEQDTIVTCGFENAPVELFAMPGFDLYDWFKNGSLLVQSGSSNSFLANQSGDYSVSVTNENGCSISSEDFVCVAIHPIPPVNLNADKTEICFGDNAALSANSGMVSYSWAPIDGLSCTDCANPIAMPSTTTTYSVAIIDHNGCENLDELTITVNEAADLLLSTDIEQGCEGEIVLLETDGNYSDFIWFRNNYLEIAEGETLSQWQVEESGSYHVTAKDENGCDVVSNQVTIKLFELPVPVLTISGDAFCNENLATITTDEGYSQYEWIVNGNSLGFSNDNSIVISESAVVQVSVTNETGCSGTSEELFVPYFSSEQPSIAISGNPVLCENDAIYLTVAGNYDIINWMFNSEELAYGHDNTLTVQEPGNYSVYVMSYDGCDGLSDVVTISQNLAFSVTLSPDEVSYCDSQNDSHIFTAPAGFENYKWIKNGIITVQNGADASFEATTSGYYQVEIEDVNGCSSLSNAVELSFNYAPPLNLSATNAVICLGESTQFFTNDNGQHYQWLPDNGTLSCTDCPNPVATPNNTTNYNVTISDENGCTASDNMIITVNPLPQINITAINGTIACEGNVIALQATPGYSSYVWMKDGITTVQIGDSYIYMATMAGSYTVSGINEYNCESTSTSIAITFADLPELTLDIEGDYNFCDGGEIIVSASDGFDHYYWFLNGELWSNTSNQSVTITENATVYVVAYVSHGCEVTSEVIEVSANPLPAPAIIILGETTICEGESLELVIPGNYSFIQWYKDGLELPGASDHSLVIDSAGDYTVFVDDNNGCSGTSETVVVTINNIDIPQITGIQTACSEDTDIVLSTTEGFINYDWYRNGIALVQSGVMYEMTTNIPGDYTVAVTNENGCTFMSESFAAYISPNPPLNLIASSNYLCQGETVELSVNSSAVTVEWISTDISLSCSDCPNPSAMPEVTTTYSVVITDTNGCTAEGDIVIEVGSFTDITIDGPNAICPTGAVEEIVAEDGFSNYQWFYNGNVIFQANGNVLFIDQPGDYWVIASSNDACAAQSETMTVNEMARPKPEVIIANEGNVCNNEDFILTTAANNNGEEIISFVWYQGAIGLVVGNNQSIVVVDAGSYSVEVTYANGCSNTSDVVQIFSDIDGEAPLVIVNGSTDLCSNDEIAMSVIGFFDVVEWYMIGENEPISNESTLIVTEVGSYYVVAENANCSATSEMIQIDASELQAPTIEGEPFNCSGEDVVLYVNNNFSSYQWYFNGLPLPISNQYFINAVASGSYTVEVSHYDCIAMSEPFMLYNIGIDDTYVVTPNEACIDTPVYVAYNGPMDETTVFTWNWDGAQYISGNIEDGFMLSWNTPGFKTITLNVVYQDCSFDISSSLYIGTIPASMDVFATPTSACDTNDGSTVITSSGDLNDYSIQWNGPYGYVSNGAVLTNIAIGEYIATITNINSGCSIIEFVTVQAQGAIIQANNDEATTNMNTAVIVCPLENDNGQNILLTSIIVNGTNGTGTVSGDCVIYEPNDNYVGIDQMVYQIIDDCGATTEAIIYITIVDGTNEPPVIPEVEECTGLSTPIEICLPEMDQDGDYLTIVDGYTTYNCSLILLNNHCFLYTPLPGFEGEDTVVLTVCDDGTPQECITVEIIIHVGCGEVVAVDDNASVNCSQSNGISIQPMLNDIDTDSYCSEGLSFTILEQPANGTATQNGEAINFIPNGNFDGYETIVYEVCNSCGNCDTAVVTIDVTCNDINPPCESIEFYCTEEVTPIEICPEFCAFSDNSDLNFYSILSTYQCNISLSNTTMCFVYHPLPGFEGMETIEAIACNPFGICDTSYINISVGDCDESGSTIVANDDYATISMNENVSINVLSNDEGNNIELCDYTLDNNAIIEILNGEFVITPLNGFFGDLIYTYTVCDDEGNSDTATVTITVIAPCAETITICTPAMTAVELCPDFCDIDNVESLVAHTTFNCSLQQQNDCVLFTPLPGAFGFTSVEVVGCDDDGNCESIFYNIQVGCSTPTAIDDYAISEDSVPVTMDVLANDSNICNEEMTISILGDPANGSVGIIDNQVVYTPNAGFEGEDAFLYEACTSCGVDEYNCIPATGVISVTQSFELLANDDFKSTARNTNVIISVKDNDIDPEGMEALINGWTLPQSGELVLLNEEFLYIPALDYLGEDQFDYEICVGAICDQATVTITVTDDIIAVDDTYTIAPNTMETLAVTVNDSGNSIQVTEFSYDGNGSVILDGNNLIYTAPSGTGMETITYTICEAPGGSPCDEGLVTIQVFNGTPVANDDFATTLEGVQVIIDVLANDENIADNMALNIFQAASNGQVIVNNDGTITYIPTIGFVGVDEFQYEICDAFYNCFVATVSVTVTDDMDLKPTAVDDSVETEVNTSIQISVVANDSDPNNEMLTVTQATPAEYGTVEVLGNLIVYLPNEDFIGTDQFTYIICNESGYCDEAVVTIIISNCVAMFPTGFSPNADQLNDTYEVLGLACYDIATLSIVNRWGNVVFETQNARDKQWDGNYEKTGEAVPDGTYFYVAELKNPNIPVKSYTGFITVRR